MDETPVGLEDLITHVRGQHPAGDALQHVSAAVEVTRQLSELTDRLVGHYVDQARKTGASWAAIGQSMGVSKQAAQQRFADKTSDIFREELRADELGSVFERSADRAMRVVVQAEEEARARGHNSIGTEHILLGLIHQGQGVAATALQSLGISLEGVRQQVDEIIGWGKRVPRGHIEFTPRAKLALELSSPSSWRLRHDYVGTEHLLLGLLWEGKGVAAQVLGKLGIEERITATLNEARPQSDRADRRPAGPPEWP